MNKQRSTTPMWTATIDDASPSTSRWLGIAPPSAGEATDVSDLPRLRCASYELGPPGTLLTSPAATMGMPGFCAYHRVLSPTHAHGAAAAANKQSEHVPNQMCAEAPCHDGWTRGAYPCPATRCGSPRTGAESLAGMAEVPLVGDRVQATEREPTHQGRLPIVAPVTRLCQRLRPEFPHLFPQRCHELPQPAFSQLHAAACPASLGNQTLPCCGLRSASAMRQRVLAPSQVPRGCCGCDGQRRLNPPICTRPRWARICRKAGRAMPAGMCLQLTVRRS